MRKILNLILILLVFTLVSCDIPSSTESNSANKAGLTFEEYKNAIEEITNG